MKSLFVDIHALQTLAPNCLNRDDTGTPKTAIYGGVQRSRVSSQAWKKAIRDRFQDLLAEEEKGYRTKRIVGMVADEILALNPEMKPEKAEKEAETALKNAGLKIKNAKAGTDALFLLGKKQAQELARLSVDGEKDKVKYKKAITDWPSVDMALFGRMVADDPSMNYDAASQVAHAISTHKAVIEYDYFTAVDDKGEEDNAGAGHIGINEFSSSTLYRYATVNVAELYRNLGLKTPEAICEFVEAFIRSMPTGKQNSYASRTLPCSVWIAVREDQPVSMVGAFEKPVERSKDSEGGYEENSQRRLVEYAEDLYQDFISQPSFSCVTGKGIDKLGEHASIDKMLEKLKSDLETRLEARAEK